MSIESLMKSCGCLESVMIPLDTDKVGHRMKFQSNEAARAHQRTVRCGGWLLGPYLFAGTEWAPSAVMEHCPGDGVREDELKQFSEHPNISRQCDIKEQIEAFIAKLQSGGEGK